MYLCDEPSFREYLTNPENFLDKNIRPMGYKTCHVLNSSLDATVCAKDCDRQEKQKFAKDCKKKGGLFPFVKLRLLWFFKLISFKSFKGGLLKFKIYKCLNLGVFKFISF